MLIVPNSKAPPRVPKVVTAIAYNLTIVDFTWLTKGKVSENTIESYKMEYSPCDSLFTSYAFKLPQTRQIQQKGS